MFLADEVLECIALTVGAAPAERGGALLGIIGRNTVTRFIFDNDAEPHTALYVPSTHLVQAVRDTEATTPLEFKGILHSHPGMYSEPSGQDAHQFATGLRLNPHLPVYLAPIVTLVAAGACADNELPLGTGRISCFIGLRGTGNSALVRPIRPVVIPMREHLQHLAREYGIASNPEVFVTEFAGVHMMASRISLADLELLFLFGELYPGMPPVLLATPAGGNTTQVHLEWDIVIPPAARLLKAVRAVVEPPTARGRYARLFGPRGGPPLTDDPSVADLLRWGPILSCRDAAAEREQITAGLAARTGEIAVGQADRSVMIVGLGSVGSYIAEQLARSGVGRLVLIDPDHVAPENLSRTVYDATDIGRSKVAALSRRLLSINPSVKLVGRELHVRDMDTEDFNSLVSGADLVMGLTDDQDAQRAVNRFAYGRGIPAIFAGIYERADGGEVIVSLPGVTPCYQCATSTRHVLHQQLEVRHEGGNEPATDYSTGRLMGAAGLGADIQHIASCAVKLALAQLVSSGAPSLTEFLQPVVQRGRSYIILSTVGDYWFFPEVFEAVLSQQAYQSLWIAPQRTPECPVCGGEEYRIDPSEIPLRPPSFRS